MTAMEDDVDDRFAGIDIDSLLNRSTERRPFSIGRKKTLYEAPEFIQRLNGEETVMEGQSLCIECKVRGFPAPTLRWFKDSEEILDHPRIHVESNGTGAYFLIIDNVNRGDEAAYRCRAENIEGQCSSYFFLSVKAKPKSPNRKKNSGSSPNKRTVSFPPMFATIVEKVEEEEKQGKEQEKAPPSPMTEFYYALTLKGRQSFPEFVGDWAFANGGHSHKRRNSTGSISSQNYEFSSDDEVFSEEENEKDYDEGPPAKKPLFFIDDDENTINANAASPTESLTIYNSNVIPKSTSTNQGSQRKDVNLHNQQNNNAPLGATKEVLDNRETHSKQDNKGNHPKQGTGYKDSRGADNNVTASKTTQGDINENSMGSKSLARVITSQVPTAHGNTTPRSTAVKEEKDKKGAGKANPQKIGGSLQGQTTNQPSVSNMNVNCVNVIAPNSSSKGDVTPPIVVEMWGETDASVKMPKSTENTLNPHQVPTGSSSKTLSTMGHSREEREPTPTPFFSDQTTQRQRRRQRNLQHQQLQQQQQQQQQQNTVGPALCVPGKNYSKEGEDFQREPTPFYDQKKDINKDASHGTSSLGVPGASDQSVRSPRESTPYLQDKKSNLPHQQDGMSNLAASSSSLAVPTTGGVRNARESTPYYDESNPYEYIHHPDHHFDEKKSVLVKQNSKEDEPTTPESRTAPSTANMAALSSSSSKVTATPAKRPTVRPPEPPSKPPQNLPLRNSTRQQSPETCASRRSCSPSNSYQRRLRDCRQTPPPESREISGNTSKVATLQSPVKPSQSVISLIPGKNLTMDKSAPISPPSYEDATAPSTNANHTGNLQPKSLQGYKMTAADVSFSKQTKESSSGIGQDKKIEISKTTSTTRESSKTKTVTVNKKIMQDNVVVSSSSLQNTLQSVSKEETKSALSTRTSGYQSTMNSSVEQTKTTTDTQKQSLITSKPQTKIPVHTVAPLTNTQIKTVSETSSAKLQASAITTSKDKMTTVTSTSRTTSIPMPKNFNGPTPQKTAPLAAQESTVVKVSIPVNAASMAASSSKTQISQQLSSQVAPSSASARPKPRIQVCVRAESPEVPDNTTMAIGTSEYEQGDAFADDTPLLGSDSKPKRSLFSNIISSRQDTRMSSTPPADTTWKKKESKSSGFSGALSSFLRPRRGKDNNKEETSVKEKNKPGNSGSGDADGRKKSTKDKPEGAARRVRRLTQTITMQDLSKYSPFGSHTTEGFCFLFVMAIVCLYLNMPIEKFVCYVLAAFYTFCVLRILGLVE